LGIRDLCTGLMDFYGRAGKSMVMRIGRISTRYAIEQQGGLYNVAAMLAAKVMPAPIQIKIVLENMQSGLRKLHKAFGEDLHVRVEDRGDRWAYISEECPSCAGKCADTHICWLFTGNIQEGVHWITGKDFPVEEGECRAMGAPACVWEVSKTPRE
jgi:predicted hydrocarbon binding protein